MEAAERSSVSFSLLTAELALVSANVRNIEVSIIMTVKASYLDWVGVVQGVVSRTVLVDFQEEAWAVTLVNTP